MTAGLNWIDNNIVWDVRNAEPGTPGQRGCAGSGIFENAAGNIVIAHNLIGRCDNAGIFTTVRPDRGRPVSEGSHVANNIFAKCKAGIVFLSRNNKADGNVYVDMAGAFQGLLEVAADAPADPEMWRRIQYSDLASWRAAYGWDRSSVVTTAAIDFDPGTLQLKFSAPKRLPRVSALAGIETDILGKATGRTRIAGPLADLRAAQTIDPRVVA
jgi:hypothetical protein